jgi:UDP-glucose 4-epimerase
VTGGAGFIGSHLVEALVARGAMVRVVDNLSTGRRENLSHVAAAIDFVEGDLTDPDVAASVCDDVKAVFHLAAQASVPESMARPTESVRHNLIATVNILAAARDAAVPRTVLSSSSSVYGNGGGASPKREDARLRPGNPYAASKASCEVYAGMFAAAFGVDSVCLRYFNVYGPRQAADGPYSAVFPALLSRMLEGRRPVVHGDGRQTRDFVYVDDVVRANLLAAERKGPFRGKAINIALGKCVSVLDIVSEINKALGTDLAPVHVGPRPGDVRDSCGDIRLAGELLGYVPRVDVDEGLRRTTEHFRASARGSGTRIGD